MSLQESGEMYLETIHVLSLTHDHVRSIDVSEEMGYSRPSVSRAIGVLKRDGYVTSDENGHLHLTESGRKVAETIYERHTVLTDALSRLGVDPKIAAKDACRIEHVISPETFDALKKHLRQQYHQDF